MRLTSLHFLRAMGAIFVVVAHSHGLIRKRFESLGYSDIFWQIEQGSTKLFGAIGVDVFLVLCGFFVFYSTWNKNNHAMDFLQKKLVRILPIWWVALLFLILFSLIPGTSASYSLLQILNSIILNPTYINGQIKPPILEVGWTLNFIVFYFLSIACLMLFRFSAVKILKNVTALLILFSILGIYIDTEIASIEIMTDSRMLTFACGGWIAFLLKEKAIDWRKSHTIISVLVIILFTSLFIFVENWRLNVPPLLTRSPIAIALILIFIFSKKLSSYNFPKLFTICGDASYSIYLFHMFPLMTLSGFWKRGMLLPPEFISPIFTWVILTVLSVTCGIVAYFLFEKPINKYLKCQFNRDATLKKVI